MFTPRSPALTRYQWRVGLASIAYVAIIFAVGWLFRHHPPAGVLRYPVAALSALPIIAVFAALGRYLVDEGDEYQRMMMVRQALWGTGGAMALCTIWGFVETYAALPHLPLYFAAVIWFGCFGLAGCARWIDR